MAELPKYIMLRKVNETKTGVEYVEYQVVEELPTQSNAPNTLDALTNADRIRSMTDEEMVNQFTETMGFCCPVKGADCSLEPDCRVCFDRWLKQEVEEKE